MRLAPLVGLLLAALGSACTERGDLGRPRPSFLADGIAPVLGTQAAALRGEPASTFALTDDETELRRRAWRFLMPSADQNRFEDALADAVRGRILPRAAHPFDSAAYHGGLMAGPFRSAASRYRRLGDDAAADAALIAPFAALSLQVIEANRVRLTMLDRVRPADASQVEMALGRVAENRCLIGWVREAAGERALAYRAALAALVVEAPQGEAIGAERALAELGAALQGLDGLPRPARAACGGEGGPVSVQPPPARGTIVAKG